MGTEALLHHINVHKFTLPLSQLRLNPNREGNGNQYSCLENPMDRGA